MRVAVIGLGLIGGSFALALKDRRLADEITGVDSNPDHCNEALSLRLIDNISPLSEAVVNSDLIVLAMPVHAIVATLPSVLDLVDHQTVIDVGSTKQDIVNSVSSHSKRSHFVATHPMWGTEYSGPQAAVHAAFIDKATVLCDTNKSDTPKVKEIEALYKALGMHVMYMKAADHDLHVAYISHISHITSFALANTVLEKEKEDDTIFELASAGFASTVRLAKSNPLTWASIFMQNRENVLDVLNEHISQLRKFKSCLEKENYEYLESLMVNANKIKRILK